MGSVKIASTADQILPHSSPRSLLNVMTQQNGRARRAPARSEPHLFPVVSVLESFQILQRRLAWSNWAFDEDPEVCHVRLELAVSETFFSGPEVAARLLTWLCAQKSWRLISRVSAVQYSWRELVEEAVEFQVSTSMYSVQGTLTL